MPYVSIVFGLLLAALGAYTYSIAGIDPEKGTKSLTAAIPALPGVLLIVLGAVALVESLLKHAMHAAATVGLLGFLAGAIFFGMQIAKGTPLSDNKSIAGGGMAALSLVFVILCVNSFIQARRRQAARAQAEQAQAAAS
jgi:heme/copper-type cytochrome/quinol oxidase subunit 3